MKQFNVTVVRTTTETYTIQTQSAATLHDDVSMHEALRSADKNAQIKILHYEEIFPAGSTVYYCASPGEVFEYKVIAYLPETGYTLDRGTGKAPLEVTNTKHLSSSYWEVGYGNPGEEAKKTLQSLDEASANQLLEDMMVDTLTYLDQEAHRRKMKTLLPEIHDGPCTFIADGKVYYKIKKGQ
jgi:hypothetical protein